MASAVPELRQQTIRRLLVVCTGNLCRSPMAAALLSARARQRRQPLQVASAGIAAAVGRSAPSPVLELMSGRGLDLSEHRAQQLTVELANEHELLLVMETAQQRWIERSWSGLKGRVQRIGVWRNQDVPDPYGLTEERYADCLARLEACVGDWEARLL